MYAQWQLIDVETKKSVIVDEPIELVDHCKSYFDNRTLMTWEEAMILFGNSCDRTPIGVLKIIK